jgi:hypothetical protein
MRFSSPVQTGPTVHPASFKIGTGSFPGVKRPGLGVENPPLSSAEFEDRDSAIHLLPLWTSWPVIGELYLPLPLIIIIIIIITVYKKT